MRQYAVKNWDTSALTASIGANHPNVINGIKANMRNPDKPRAVKRLLAKRVAAFMRKHHKEAAAMRIPFLGVVNDKRAMKNLRYLDAHGLLVSYVQESK